MSTDKPQYPRVTLAEVLSSIKSETFTVLPDGRTTICQLTLANGFSVTGESACVSVENFDPLLGNRYAKEKALDKVWMLRGYQLAEDIYQGKVDKDHRERVRKERDDVSLKLARLTAFMDMPNYAKMPERARAQLERQRKVLEGYQGVLGERIADFDKPDTTEAAE